MIKDILNFPKFVAEIASGFVRAAITDVEVFLIVLFGVLLSFTTGPLIGATAALFVYLFFRMTAQIASMFSIKLDFLLRLFNND